MIARFAWIFCLLCSQVQATEPANQRFSRDISFAASGQQLLAVPLDSLVYANSAADFRDLRLIDQNGSETPYLLQKIASQQPVTRRQPSRSETVALQKSGDDGIVISVKLAKDAANADGLSVVTSQHDFEYELQIHGSNDGQTWQLLTDKALIFDYSRHMNIGNRDIALPANSYRQFKIFVAKASQTRAAEILALTRTLHGSEELQRQETTNLRTEPLHIERIELWHKHSETLAGDSQTFEYPITGFKISHDAEHKTSVIEVDSHRQPLTGLLLKIDTPNFNRAAQVQIPLLQGIETRMQTIGSGTLDALHFQDINRDQTEINFPEQRQPHYRIVIENQDNPPLHINTVVGTGLGYQLLFLPQAGFSYRLFYGAEHLEKPNYDLASFQELLRRGYQSSSGQLGAETAISPLADHFNWAEFLNGSWFLGAAIVLMVIVLAWSLYRVGKRLGDMPDSNRPE